jgi:solute carrier family 25 S-adenosylmethionine transporter 26
MFQSGLQFTIYEQLKLALARQSRRAAEDLPAWQAARCGCVAGSISGALTTPIDLVRTRVNLRGSAGCCTAAVVDGRAKVLHELAVEEARCIYNLRGFRGFFAGAGFRAVSMGAGGFLFLGAFESMKGHLSNVSVTLP